MENPEETLQILEEWGARRARACGGGALPRQLDEYLTHVARTGDPVFHWASVKPLIKEKLLNAVSEFHETAPGLDVPLAPNVDPFNYEAMRALLIERLDSFAAAPFTVQRLCELLTAPRKQYNRIDKFMRAVEKNVLVVSTREPGVVRREIEEPIERALNGSDGNSDCGVDVDMEDSTWRDSRHPVVDPLAGASDRPDADQPSDISLAAPVVAVSLSERTSPSSEEKMEETQEVMAENELESHPPPEKTKSTPSEKETPDEIKPEPSTAMEIVASKEPALENSNQSEPTESSKTETIEPISSPKSSEEDSNSNPEPQTHSAEEPKSDPVTSGEDSSSSNSSENTDGESERGGGDSASRSPERSAASEGESSSDVPDHDVDSNPKSETNEKMETKVPVQAENYTVADIHTTVEPTIETAAVLEPKVHSPPPKTDPSHEEMETATSASLEEPAQTELTEEPAQTQSK